MAEEIMLVAEAGDPEAEDWQRSITAEYDPEHKLVQFVQCGEEVFGTLEPVTPEEWQEISDRLCSASFMQRVLDLVQEIDRIADGAEPVPDLQRELRQAVKQFAGAIEPEEAVEVAHSNDPQPGAWASLVLLTTGHEQYVDLPPGELADLVEENRDPEHGAAFIQLRSGQNRDFVGFIDPLEVAGIIPTLRRLREAGGS